MGDPRGRLKNDAPEAWALVVVGRDAVVKDSSLRRRDPFLDSIQAAFDVDKDEEFHDPNLTIIRAKGTVDDTAVLRKRAGILTTVIVVIVEGDDAETYHRQLGVADGFGLYPMVVAVGEEAFQKTLEDELRRPVNCLELRGPGRFAIQDRKALMLLQACRDVAVRWVPTQETADKYSWDIVEYADLLDKEPVDLERDMDITPSDDEWNGLSVKDALRCLVDVPDTREPPSYTPALPTRESLNMLQRAICQHMETLGKGAGGDWVGSVNLIVDTTTRMLRPFGPCLHKNTAIDALRILCEAFQEAGVSVSKAAKDFIDKAVQSTLTDVHVSIPDATELFNAENVRAVTMNLGGFYNDAFEAGAKAWLVGLVTLLSVPSSNREQRWKLFESVVAAATTAVLAATQGGRALLAWRMAWATMDLATTVFSDDMGILLPVLFVMPQALMALCGHDVAVVGEVPVYLLRVTLFVAERQLKSHDTFLADVLEALGAVRLRTATGPRRMHQIRCAGEYLQSALRIREREECVFLQAAAAQQGSSPDEEAEPQPPVLPLRLAVPLASNAIHLAEYEIVTARFLRTRRFRRALQLHKAYASVSFLAQVLFVSFHSLTLFPTGLPRRCAAEAAEECFVAALCGAGSGVGLLRERLLRRRRRDLWVQARVVGVQGWRARFDRARRGRAYHGQASAALARPLQGPHPHAAHPQGRRRPGV